VRLSSPRHLSTSFDFQLVWRSARLDLAPGKFSPKLGVAEKELNEPLDAIPGVRVERKRFSIAVHYCHGEEIGVPQSGKL